MKKAIQFLLVVVIFCCLVLPFIGGCQTFRDDFLREQKSMFAKTYETSDTMPHGIFLNSTTRAIPPHYAETEKTLLDTCEVWALIIVDTITGYSETKRVFMETTGDKAADLALMPPPEGKKYWYLEGEYRWQSQNMSTGENNYIWINKGKQIFIDPKLVLMTFKK